jgi:hypothetical protein
MRSFDGGHIIQLFNYSYTNPLRQRGRRGERRGGGKKEGKRDATLLSFTIYAPITTIDD